MYTPIFWIADAHPGRLGIMARPRGGDWLDDELQALRRAGVPVLVSLLTPSEEFALDLVNEAHACATNQIAFCSLPIPDRQVPPRTAETIAFVRHLVRQREHGHHIVLHCRMGIGHSALMAASVLVLLGMTADEAWTSIAQARGGDVPDTLEQRTWVEQLAQRHHDNGNREEAH